MADDNALIRLQRNNNTKSADLWAESASHRHIITQLLQRATAAPPDRAGQRLAVLGAGNSNDLELATLLKLYAEVALIDLDGEALSRGVQAQNPGGHPGLKLFGDFDVSGIIDDLSTYETGTKSDECLNDLVRLASSADIPMPDASGAAGGDASGGGEGGFDAVISTCLLSQIIACVQRVAGENSPAALKLIEAVRLRHLQLISGWLRPGGQGLLVTDFNSSDAVPDLASIPAQALPQTLVGLIKQQNFFTGLNPFGIQALFKEDPVLAQHTHDVRCTKPWLWDFGSRHYAVVAVMFTRR